MKKTVTVLAAMCTMTAVSAQKAYTYVQQDGKRIEALGTAAFDLADCPTVTFQDGKAVMTADGNTVAVLPLAENGGLVVEFSTDLDESEVNVVTKEVGGAGYATYYSPFQLQVPAQSDVEVYSPTFDSENHMLLCNGGTQVNAGGILPAGTGILLRNEGTVQFTISAQEPTAFRGALSGSALQIPASSVDAGTGKAVYTLGHDKYDNSRFGFLKYTGQYLNAGCAYLIAPYSQASMAPILTLDFGLTGTESIRSDALPYGKFLEDGRVTIRRDGLKYDTDGHIIR